MEIKEIPVSQLIELREFFRSLKDWEMCDNIRDYLDTQHTFVFDTPDGQEVYFEIKGTRQDVIDRINIDKKAEAEFDAWLFSTNESWKAKLKKK